MAGEVTEGATLLKDKLEEEGSLTVDEARAFLRDNGLEGNLLNLSIGYGQPKRLGWYHKRDGSLYPGPADGAEGAGGGGDIPNPQDLSTPREQFESVARMMGIKQSIAQTAAFYLDNGFDLTDPASTWDGITKMLEIGTAQKKRLWQTWVSFLGSDLSPEIVKKVERGSAALVALDRTEASTNGHKPVRRFVAVNGEVLPTDSEDESAMSFAEAIQAANLQVHGRPEPGNDQSGLIAALHESGETTRELIKANAEARRPTGDDGNKATMDLMMKWMDSRMDAERERTNGLITLINEQNDRNNERMTEALGQVAAAVGNKKGPFAELDEIMPGFGTKVLEKFLNPPEPAKPSGSLTIGGDGMEGDRIVVNNVDDYVKIKKVNQAGAALTMARESMPKLLQVGERIAMAIDRSTKADKAVDQQEEQETVQAKCTNPDCAQDLQVKKGAKAFQCPWCRAVQDLDGNRLDGPMEGREEAEPEARPMPGATASDETAPPQATVDGEPVDEVTLEREGPVETQVEEKEEAAVPA